MKGNDISPEEGLMMMSEAMEPLIAAAAGYRKLLESKGFNETISEALAANYLMLLQMKALTS